MRGGVEQKKEQKKEGLLEAAYQLFLEKGVNKTSVDFGLSVHFTCICKESERRKGYVLSVFSR